MRKLFTIVLVMVAAIALVAGPVAAQSGSTPIDKEKLKNLNEFLKGGSGANQPAKGPSKQAPAKPAVQPPPKPAVQPATKPVNQTTGKGVVLPPIDKSKATYVGKVSDKMSPERKACVDKCEAGGANCSAKCKSAGKTRDIYESNDCYQCSNAISYCINRCPAK